MTDISTSSSNNKTIYCGNCGKKGHIYKNCFLPIVSFGIICIQFPEIDLNDVLTKHKNNKYIFSDLNRCSDKELLAEIKDKLKFLMICRKQTLGFAEFIRGNYRVGTYAEIKYIKHLFTIMTKHEIELIKECNFDVLWKYLWCMEDSMNYHQNEYMQSKEKFHALVNGITINNYQYTLEGIIRKIIPVWDEPEWGFPKGRRNYRETDLDCAIREFSEETAIPSNMYHVLDINPFNEEFMGTNNVNYKHTYYLAQVMSGNIQPVIKDENIHQRIEISDIAWMTFEEAKSKIRYYNKQKRYVLEKIYNILVENIYNNIKQHSSTHVAQEESHLDDDITDDN